jgi:hypothetical protein
MDISEIRKKWDNGDYTYKTDIPKKVSEDHIFDEELSVRRNRELAKEHNQKVVELRAELQKQQNLLYQQLTDDIIKYIQENYNLNEMQARKVERFVYQEYHSYMGDYFCYIDTFAEFASDLINMEN